MSRIPPPNPPFEGPAAHDSGPGNMPVNRIVIHSTVSPCKAGGRHDIAAFFKSPLAKGSAHYIVDPVGIVQSVGDHTIAWHAPPNPHSLGIEMCDIPGPLPGDKFIPAVWKAAKRRWRWNKPEQQAMLHLTAQLAAQLCGAYDVPPRWVGVSGLRKGRKGITSHNNVSQAFGESTHWDPGFWPRRKFMTLVRQYLAELKKEHDQ